MAFEISKENSTKETTIHKNNSKTIEKTIKKVQIIVLTEMTHYKFVEQVFPNNFSNVGPF